MIARISGKIVEKREGLLLVQTGGFSYEIIIPGAIMKAIDIEYTVNSDIELITYHFYQNDQSKSIPVLIGFQNEVEKEFFEKFITVSGVGPKAACRALVEPLSIIAGAIDAGDTGFLKKLPGIGEQRAKLIVAKLQGKVGKYGLMQDRSEKVLIEDDDISSEAIAVLLQLQYKKNEAENMVIKALEREPEIKTCEELLNEVYRDRREIT
jgi:holliday junction DNA helicase RuvA